VRVRYTENATAELARIFEYIARDNPSAADAVVRRVEEVAIRLAMFPGTGHACDTAGVLVAPLVRFPYAIYYKVEGDELLILHVHHGARRQPQFHEAEVPFGR
jgi:toxin ParE1/3/4